jgi:arylformamidase
MKIYDITRPLSESTLVCPGDIHPMFSQKEHGGYRISDLLIGTHTGTHIDAPAHCIGYTETIDRISLGSLVGPCRVIDARSAGLTITPSFLRETTGKVQRILLKTAYSESDSYDEVYPVLSPEAAHFLTEHGTLCLGIDSPSVEPPGEDGTVHRLLLGGGCTIIELLDFSGVPADDYTMVALPLRLAGLDGSPARVILMKNQEM